MRNAFLTVQVRVKEVESIPKAIHFPCDHRKIVRLQNQNKLVNEFQKSIYTRAQ